MQSLLIGTLFEEDELDQKQNFYSQVAKDHLGHKRFHGAFTGGFEAGYKNTVGSKEGFQPKNFFSSTKNRAKYKQQTVLDFMDEEDRGIAKLGESIQAKSEFDGLGLKQQQILKQSIGVNQHLGEVPKELICVAGNSVGRQIFLNLKKNQSDIPTKKIKKEPQQLFVKKNNYYGFGYDENNDGQDEFEAAFESEFKSILKKFQKNQDQFDQIEKEKEQQKIRLNNIFQDNHNYYEDNVDVQYNTHETQLNLQQDKNINQIEKKQINIERIKNIFHKVIQIQQSKQEEINLIQESQLIIPQGYDPTKKVKEAIQQQQTKKQMNYLERSKLLEDGPKMNENVSKEIKQKILGVKKFVKGEIQEMNLFDLRAYIQDPAKLERYQKYIKYKDSYNLGLTNPVFAKEVNEFENISNLQFRDQKLKQINELEDIIKKERMRRQVIDWWPSHLLCKRFGVIPQNKSKQTFIMNQDQIKLFYNFRPDRFESEILPTYLSSNQNHLQEQKKVEEKQIKEQEIEEEFVEKPPQSLFKSIFEDSDED